MVGILVEGARRGNNAAGKNVDRLLRIPAGTCDYPLGCRASSVARTALRDTIMNQSPGELSMVAPAESDWIDVQAELIKDQPVVPPPTARGWLRGPKLIVSGIEWTFGVLSLIIGLSVLASIPVLQVASLGYLLEVTGRVGRDGQIRSAWIGVRRSARFGAIVACVWLLLLIPRLLISLNYSAVLINDPLVSASSPADGRAWRVGIGLLTAVILLHVVWALYRGGRLRDFLWPAPLRLLGELRRGFDWSSRWKALRDTWRSLRFTHYFWLGLQGYLTTFVWLMIPMALMAEGTRRDPDSVGLFVLVSLIATTLVVPYLPLLQAEFGRTGNWRCMFGTRRARELFVRAPWSWWLAITVLLIAALPLYLLKAELIPSELAWFPGLFFVVFIWPARVIAGWALACSLHRDRPAHWFWRWTARLGLLVVSFIYAGVLYFTPQFSWYGARSLFEHHAFLVPAPFLGF